MGGGLFPIKIMAKIETQMAVDLIDGIPMPSVARGELRDIWTLPMVTCDITNAQVCSSMATQSIPTRAVRYIIVRYKRITFQPTPSLPKCTPFYFIFWKKIKSHSFYLPIALQIFA